MRKIKVGITIGDFNGIGMEVIIKTLANKKISEMCTPIIYGSSKVLSYHKNIVGIDDFQFQTQSSAERIYDGKVNVVNCWEESVNITLGRETEESGRYAFASIQAATADLKRGLIDAVVTAPINKKAMQLADFPFVGHTEYFTQELDSKESLMLMVNEGLRIGLVTNHLPIREVAENVTKERILQKLKIFQKSLTVDFGIERPTIALLGLNPHAGDNGAIGDEDDKLIRPIIIEAKKKDSMLAMGPYSADGFFGSGAYKKFDGILAMYHDQGLIPFKALSFGNGVNFTAGLKGVRTSPDHGTAYEIAGQNQADPSSFRQALFTAIDIARNRKDHAEDHENPLVRNTKMEKEKAPGN